MQLYNGGVFMCFSFFYADNFSSSSLLTIPCTMWISKTGMHACGAGLLSKTQVADSSTSCLPAKAMAKWKCPVFFSVGKPPGVEQQGPVNYTPGALDLAMQNQCSFAASLFCAMSVIPPSALAQLPTSRAFVHLKGTGRISVSSYTLIAQWE